MAMKTMTYFPFVVHTWYCLWGPMNVSSLNVSHHLVLAFCTALCVPMVMTGMSVISSFVFGN